MIVSLEHNAFPYVSKNSHHVLLWFKKGWQGNREIFTFASELLIMCLNLCPTINCHPLVSQAGRGNNVFAEELKTEDLLKSFLKTDFKSQVRRSKAILNILGLHGHK